MLKKFITFFLAVVLVLSINACGNNSKESISTMDSKMSSMYLDGKKVSDQVRKYYGNGRDAEKNKQAAKMLDDELKIISTTKAEIEKIKGSKDADSYKKLCLDEIASFDELEKFFQHSLTQPAFTYNDDPATHPDLIEMLTKNHQLTSANAKARFAREEFKDKLNGKTKAYKTKIKSRYPEALIKAANLPKEIEIAGKYSSNVGIAITSIKTTDKVASGEYLDPVKPVGKFIIVGLRVRNEQKDAITVDAASFKLLDKAGHEFSHSDEAMTALMFTKENKGFLTSLNPLMQIDFEAVFDIPKELNIKDLSLEGHGGFMGDKFVMPLKVTYTGS